MKVTAKPANKDGKVRIISNQTLSVSDDVTCHQNGDITIRFSAIGIDNENATYKYTIRLSADDVRTLTAARYVQPLLEKIEELEERLSQI